MPSPMARFKSSISYTGIVIIIHLLVTCTALIYELHIKRVVKILSFVITVCLGMKPLNFKKIVFKDTMGKSKQPIPLILKQEFSMFLQLEKKTKTKTISFEHPKLILTWTRF